MSNEIFPMRERLKIASAALALILTAFYFAPLSVLLVNAREISAAPSNVVGLSWKLQLVFIAATAVILVFLPSSARRTARA